MKGETEAKWITTETQTAQRSAGTLAFIGKGAWKMHTGQSQSILNTVKNWKHIGKILKINSECVYLREMVHSPDFTPNRTDQMLDCWANKGSVTSSQLLTKNTKDSFEIVASKFELDPKHFEVFILIEAKICRRQANYSN